MCVFSGFVPSCCTVSLLRFYRFFPAGIQTDSVLSARLQIIRIYIREDGRLVIEFKTHAKFRGRPHLPGPCSRFQGKSEQ